ncbi:hypothetical protein FQR65_LT19916 [Abscondita terminalis]|nr:hypothetical protein FQR65_LT19916 [Abscondita terminalis]
MQKPWRQISPNEYSVEIQKEIFEITDGGNQYKNQDMKIIAFGGSNSSKSINKMLATYASGLFEDAEVEILDLNDFEMRFFRSDRKKRWTARNLRRKFCKTGLAIFWVLWLKIMASILRLLKIFMIGVPELTMSSCHSLHFWCQSEDKTAGDVATFILKPMVCITDIVGSIKNTNTKTGVEKVNTNPHASKDSNHAVMDGWGDKGFI